MPRLLVLAIFTALAVAGCASPSRPTVSVLPGTGKSLEQFAADDTSCREWARSRTADGTQRDYDIAYVQCMYSKGHQVPGAFPRSPSQAPLQPLVRGWEQFFKLDWQAEEAGGRPVVSGHVFNDWGMPAANMRLLVDGLDAEGRVVEQKVSWLGFTLTPGTRAPFQVVLAEPAAAYRVSVFAFDWVERGGLRRRF